MASAAENVLPATIIKQLNDRLYEKRKAAALEIEKLIKDYVSKENFKGVEQIITVLGRDFANASTSQPRNGGLIGLAACAIALGKDTERFVSKLVRPALNCFCDPDQRIRYYACESLYNICKVARGSVLSNFNEIFNGLSKLADDMDGNVRNGSELLDRLMKDIVTESALFNIPSFIPLLRERIYTRKPFCRRFVTSWISLLNTVPDINMLVYLPEFLDGLFCILGEQNVEVRHMCEQVLQQFSKQIRVSTEKRNQGLAEDDFVVDFSSMTNTLILHSQSKDKIIQMHAVDWLHEFLELAGRQMLAFCPGIVSSILITPAYSDGSKEITDRAKKVNSLLQSLINADDDNASFKLLDVASLVSILIECLHSDSMHTKLASLRWFLHLFKTTPKKVFTHVDEVFPLLLKVLTNESDEVVIADLYVLAEVAGTAVPASKDLIGKSVPAEVKDSLLAIVSQYFVYTVQSLLKSFSTDRTLLEEKGFFIIRQMCLLLTADDVYRSFSILLSVNEDLSFVAVMVRNLNIILLTATELFPLRDMLKTVESEARVAMFRCLYKSWCHNPVAAAALCLLTQQYRLASDLLQKFADIDITVELLTEVDKLVQLLESPIFIYLRLQLLDPSSNHYLVKALYSILMLLPQSEAFRALQARLQCVSQLHQHSMPPKSDTYANQDLLEHFKSIQDRHSAYKRLLLTHRAVKLA
ncbi:protein VAC14 homolog [Watersipora subatra]|uniref:protein VAC14 homolog n=1 Tax=Watersipora subatra TaxID=2589382 RepID=UPI00355BC383